MQFARALERVRQALDAGRRPYRIAIALAARGVLTLNWPTISAGAPGHPLVCDTA